jgi:putative membrane protein
VTGATFDANLPSYLWGIALLTPQVKGSGMVVKNLISTVFAGLFLNAVVGLAPAAAQQSLASDSAFITRAGSAGRLQVKLGQLAEEKGTSTAVVEFGKKMVTHYSKANELFKAAAKDAGFPAPPLLRRDQLTFDRFNGMGRSSFDKAYMAEMVERMNEEVRLFQGESAGGRVQSLKQLASRMLPEMEQRLSLATQTAGSVGVNVTASTSEASKASATY